MNKAMYLLLMLLIFGLTFVIADEDGDSLFGGDDNGGDSLFGGGDDSGGDSLFGGGDDSGGDSLFGGGDDNGGDLFGGGENNTSGDLFGGNENSSDTDLGIDLGGNAETSASPDKNSGKTTNNAEKSAEDYEADVDMTFTYKQIPVTPERRAIDLLYPRTIAHGETNFLPHIEIEEVPAGAQNLVVDIVEYHVQLGYTFEMSPNLYVSVGLEQTTYDFKFTLDLGAVTVENNDTLYAIDVPLGLHVLVNDQLMISLEAIPGIHTDFQGNLDERDLQIVGGLKVTYAINNTLALIAGAYVGPDLSRYQVVPVGGLLWKPDPLISAELLIPFHAKAVFNFPDFPISFVVFYESLYFKQFRLDEDNPLLNLGQDEDNLNYESMRVGLGARYNFGQGIYLEAIGGATLDGELEFNKDDDNDFSLQGGSFFGKVGFSVDMSFFAN